MVERLTQGLLDLVKGQSHTFCEHNSDSTVESIFIKLSTIVSHDVMNADDLEEDNSSE